MSARISSVTTSISEADLMENIRTFVDVEGLDIEYVKFDDSTIEAKGSYKKIITIPFLARIRILEVKDNRITLRIDKISVLKLGIPSWIIAAAGKALKSKVEEMGVTFGENGAITADVSQILKKVNHVDLKVEDISMEHGVLSLRVAGISADVKAMEKEKEEKDIEKVKAKEEAERKEAVYQSNIARIYNEQKTDEYSKIRRDIYKRVPEKYRQYYKYAAFIPDIVALAVRVILDKRVKTKDRIIIGATMGYFLSPIDIIPDKMPFIGGVDDLALFMFGVNHLITRIPEPIIVEHWSGDLKVLKFVKDNMTDIMKPLGSDKIDRLYRMAEAKLNEKYGVYEPNESYF